MMNRWIREGVFTIGDFAKFSRVTKDALLHYDRIGLLSPSARGENNYRYYSSDQLVIINVIRTLQKLGMSLQEIKKIKDNRSPEHFFEVFEKQLKKIDIKINEWVNVKNLLLALQNSINSVSGIDEQAITVQFLSEEPIVAGNLNDYSKDQNDYDALFRFYNSISKKYPNLNLNYPVWGMFSEDRIIKKDWIWPDRFYFYNTEGRDKRPAGMYAIGYSRGGYGQSSELYNRMTDYINENGFEICGNTYEEYPLNEISVTNSNNYLLRIMITVRKKTPL